MKNKITVMENNKKIEYDVLFSVKDEKHNIKYVACTDNAKDKDGNAIIYLGRYDGKNIISVSNKEKKMLEEIVNIVQKEVLKNEN